MAQYVPGSDADSEDIFQYPFTVEDETINFIKSHGKIMFIIRGPPGTGKNTLSQMIVERFPFGIKCSADDYFKSTFTSPGRNPKSLADSHRFCHQKVEKECRKSSHPIIVQNTHMRKREMQNYLDYAAKYNYTVVMAITLHKFKVTPEILAKSNTKGLKIEYFVRRLKQWEEISPVHTGWFISPKDSTYLLSQLQSSFEVLLGDGKFCRILNAFAKGEVLKHYKAKKLLYCVAGYGKNNSPHEISSYYLSDKIKDCYGRCYTTTIQAFLITESDVLAIVQLKGVMKELLFKPRDAMKPEDNDGVMDKLTSGLQSLSFHENVIQHSKTIDFDQNFSNSAESAFLENWNEEDIICLKDCSFIHLAEKDEKVFFPYKLNNILYSALLTVVDEDENIKMDQFTAVEDNFEICRLANEAWLVKLPSKISVKTIFTGLYI